MFTNPEILGAVATVMLGLVTRWLWKTVPKLYRKVRHNMFGIGDLKTDMRALSEQMNFIVAELKPNGGASVRDSLNRIELSQVLNESRQRAVLTGMDVGVFETDSAGNFTWINRKYLRMTGRAPDEVKGSGWINTVALRDRDRIISAWDDAISEEREFEDEYMMITPDNERVTVQIRTYKMANHDKESLGFLGMVTPLQEDGHKL